jgi:hypothetical protein
MLRGLFVKFVLTLMLGLCGTATFADEMTDTITGCVAAFATGDTEAYAAAAAKVRSFGAIEDVNLNKAAEACLALAPLGASPDPVEGAPHDSLPMPVDPVNDYLATIEVDPGSIEAVVKDIAESEGFQSPEDERSKLLEEAILAYVRPLPASEAQANRLAYLALTKLAPSTAQYGEKVAQYDAAIVQQAKAEEARKAALVKRLVKTTSEFDGSAWYRHPSSPRYQDIQPYVTLYVLESGTGVRSLEFFLNYTSRTGWLFVESAQINVDGEIEQLPPANWLRDNDTEIWEWAGYSNRPEMIDLARRISESERAVIRFFGQQFHDDHVISTTEKSVIRDILLAWEAMKG